MIILAVFSIFAIKNLETADTNQLSAKEVITLNRERLEKEIVIRNRNCRNSKNNKIKRCLRNEGLTTKYESLRKFKIRASEENLIANTSASNKNNDSNFDKNLPLLSPSYKILTTLKASAPTPLMTVGVDPPHETLTSLTPVYKDEGSSSLTTIPIKPSLPTVVPTLTESKLDELNVPLIYSKNIREKKLNSKMYPHWSFWSKWSQCSRSCGDGITYQRRKCIKVTKAGITLPSRGCVGIYKRYHLCNMQDCPIKMMDFRHEQCANFNNVSFQGRRYKWEPYMKENHECELNCKPIGMKYFATLNETVMDGTLCYKPAEYYRRGYRGKAMCVDGTCKALYGSGTIAGAFANSGGVPCGSLHCLSISGIFNKTTTAEGYNHIATLPAGASNISVTELKGSNNLLVLKTVDDEFVFNGNYEKSPSSTYPVAGALVDYHRIDKISESTDIPIEGVTEWLTCTGPIKEPVHLLILGQFYNPGIKYEYLLPIISNYELQRNILDREAVFVEKEDNFVADSNEIRDTNLKSITLPEKQFERRRKFSWKIFGFGPCSKSCGGGTQTPIIRCTKRSSNHYYSVKRCAHLEKPAINENYFRCNTQPCPAYWHVGEWGDCRCENGEGYKERDTRCVQELAADIVIQVTNSVCMEEEPIRVQKCECLKVHKRRNNITKRTHAAVIAQPAAVINDYTQRKMANYRKEKAGTWLVSKWNHHCSAECGVGVEHRSIFCDRSPPNINRCDSKLIPDLTKPCMNNNKSCDDGEWFEGPWTECTGDCFNLVRHRKVFCIKNQLIVDDHVCKQNQKPITKKECTISEVDYCKPSWHYSEWSECTKACGGGTQRRSVKCLEFDLSENLLKLSKLCRYSEREPIYRSCNPENCEDISPPIDVQNDVSSNCVDEFSNCAVTKKARLCSYEYYKTHCCYSCSQGVNYGNSIK